ncbi:hypothetical protein F7R91_21190 [Streptomyces luteolifulvus]|jgi:hypothetical protein|uniref:Uncharacterized protein n=1 Tax=Streptomyces luteolifulvus TaxID=2615112 RepID=A0A6H9UZM2_9ACTN|nr:hypothetical protein [Streptomyces luteolifulvus]KAB1144750.1 hypothetical protein F7R91_21190 [Streptomyces luteolifulvus]
MVVTTIATTLVALTRLVARTLPQRSGDRLEWWKTYLAYRLERRRLRKEQSGAQAQEMVEDDGLSVPGGGDGGTR